MATSARDENRHYDTIVIGAGMSGLSCAARLYEQAADNGKNRLLVLEARDRIGGRIGSVHTHGCRLDTGANWIHGVGTEDEPNPLMKVLPHKRYKELSGSVMFRPPVMGDSSLEENPAPTSTDQWVEIDAAPSASDYQAVGTDQVIPTDVSSILFGSLWPMIGSLHELATKTSAQQAKQMTMLQAITQSDAFRNAFLDVPTDYHQALRAMPQFVESMEAAPLAAQSAEHARDQRGMGLLEYAIDDFDGEQVFLRDGYLAVIDEVARHLVEANVIKLGVEVKQIAWDAEAMAITTSIGTFTADRIVCSLPLGVLQHYQQTQISSSSVTPLFKPALPQDKAEAIASLGFGTLDKIFLVFSSAWWTAEPYVSVIKKGLVRRPFGEEASDIETEDSEPDTFWGFTDELPGIEVDQDGQTKSGVRALSVINLHSLTGFPVLSSFISCANAVHVESLSDEAAGMIIHRALTRWLGREVPKHEAVHVTRWAQDEYSRGSYSHMITALSETKHRETFQQPIVNKYGAELRFAGEHTSRNHFATVHGALLSGWREADDILRKIAASSAA